MRLQLTLGYSESMLCEQRTPVPVPSKPNALKLARRPRDRRKSVPELVADSARMPLDVAREAAALLRDWRTLNADTEESAGAIEWMCRPWDFLAETIGLTYATHCARYGARSTASGLLEIYVDGWVDAQAVH